MPRIVRLCKDAKKHDDTLKPWLSKLTTLDIRL